MYFIKSNIMCINLGHMYVWFGRIFISTWNFANSFDCFNEETILIYLVDIKNVNWINLFLTGGGECARSTKYG